MKNKEEIEAFKKEISALCAKYGFVLVGTCESESIYGEIGIFDALDETNWWRDMRTVFFNFEDRT